MKMTPAIHKFSFINWGWVSLEELSEVLNLKQSEVLERFGALSKDAPQYNVLSVTFGDRIENADIDLLIERVKGNHQVGTIFVPAGWAMDVLKASSQGYTRITLELMYLPEEDEDDDREPNWLSFTHKTGFDNQYWVAVAYQD